MVFFLIVPKLLSLLEIQDLDGTEFVDLMITFVKKNEDLDQIRQAIAKSETKMSNVESIVLKMLDRWNKSDDISQRHREDIVR